MDSFLKHWFGGFAASMGQLNDDARSKILGECGKACSDSYTRQVYIDAKANASDDEAFFATLKKVFPEIGIKTIEKDRRYEITYSFCACDLVTQGFVKTPYLCECSCSSLKYNLGGVWGEGQVEVKLIGSILAGADCCRFQVVKK